MRRGIDTLRKRLGGSDEESSCEEDVSAARKGKKKAVEVIHEIPPETDGITVTQPVLTEKPKKVKQKQVSCHGLMVRRAYSQASWNPNFLPTQPDSDSSSDFDSSDSENDSPDEEAEQTKEIENEQPEAGPSSPRPKSPTPVPAKPASPILAGSAVKKPILPAPGLGGALKKSSDGLAVQPRIVVRQKMVSFSLLVSRADVSAFRSS